MKLGRQLAVLLGPLLVLLTLVGDAGSEHSPAYCGTWQEKYTRLHRAILSGQAPQRYVVALGDSGLADTLVGGVSAFYFALLSGRAFLWDHYRETRKSVDQPGERVPLEWAYDQPNINWTNIFPDARPQPRDIELLWNATDDGSGVLRLHMLNDHDNLGVEEFWERKNLSTLGEGFPRVEINTNRGMSFQLFKNPHHSRQLFDMGLRPDTAFGCIINYLLDLNQEAHARLAMVEEQLKKPGKLKIGIQIRTGDRVLKDKDQDSQQMRVYESYFTCAEDVEKTRAAAYPDGVMWYLVTDSMYIRAKARQFYGDKLIEEPLGLGLDVGHVVLHKNMSAIKPIMQTAAAENWLFAMTDVQIITRRSGFGRTAAFRSLRTFSLYTIGDPVENHEMKSLASQVAQLINRTSVVAQPHTVVQLGRKLKLVTAFHPKRKCGPMDADDLGRASMSWSRI